MESDLKPYRVLVCDDQPDVLEALRLLLKGQGWQAVTADSPQRLLETVRGCGPFDLILTDLNYTRDTTSGQEGMDLLASLEAQGNTVPVVVMTAWGNVDLAVEAMRRGACDFVQKPWDNNRLLATIRKQAGSPRAAQERTGDRGQRAAKALPAENAPPGIARLCRPLYACARSGRRLLRLPRNAGVPSVSCSATFPARASRRAPDGESSGVASAVRRRTLCCVLPKCWRRSTGTFSIPPPPNVLRRSSSRSTTTRRARSAM